MTTRQTVLTEVNEIRRYLKMQPLTESELIEQDLAQINLSPLNEGWWENAKYALSKLGRYKADGKIFGKSQTDAKANAKIMALLDKQGNDRIKELDNLIKKTNPEFPNNKSEGEYLDTIIGIAKVYDSIVAATKLKPADKGYLPIDAANIIIEDLAEYVKKYLDVDLSSSFTIFTENELTDPGSDMPLPGQNIEEADPALQAKRDQVAAQASGAKDSIKQGNMVARDSERMKTLSSNKLPGWLFGIGSALGAFGFITNTQWFKGLFNKPFSYTDTTQVKQTVEQNSEVFNAIKKGDGVDKFLTQVTGIKLKIGRAHV
jgi:hypothetical protein